jgi:hypothetical protein
MSTEIHQDLEQKLQRLTRSFTTAVKKVAETYGLNLDVIVRLNINVNQKDGVNDVGN